MKLHYIKSAFILIFERIRLLIHVFFNQNLSLSKEIHSRARAFLNYIYFKFSVELFHFSLHISKKITSFVLDFGVGIQNGRKVS